MSQAQANEVVRVLSGTRLKYTCTVHKPDGSKVEWQENVRPMMYWNEPARALWLGKNENYENFPIMEWEPGSVLIVELNPDAPK